ncbi:MULTISPECIES: hypothetical protein [unclassified Acinetobacter]|uniref:hypothetical protein n=1 Tax=unclassified Acinetobacter TaxID=196816 RepID=UPI0015D23D63|nr:MULTISPECIES: hypothetical protein [unclassified Acinetobacter]UNW06315.1 hypothetical protein MOV98_11995 [Acinetobacter variabilis]
MTDSDQGLPSIEIKTNYVHTGIVKDMIEKRKKAGVLPIAIVTTDRISGPAKTMLDENDIAWAEIPELEIRATEKTEAEDSEGE